MSMTKTKRDILITGFPSFVAREFFQHVYEKEKKSIFRLLVRPEVVDQAKRILEKGGFDEERVVVYSGDVVAIDLGLSGTEYLEVVAKVTDIYHIATIWWLGVERARVRNVNVLGARNVIDAALEMKNLNRLNHFSTAFVSGERTGVIMESELDTKQKFRNRYERTKFEAELMMRESMQRLPISIYRPTIIVGDSKTGVIDKLAGPYYLITAMMHMPANLPVVMPGKGDKPLNLVPIDFVCEAMLAISKKEGTAGKTFHLCDPNPLSSRGVFKLVADAAGVPSPVGKRVPYRLTNALLKLPFLEKVTRNPRQFLEEVNQLTIYNSINTIEALRDSDIRCPPLKNYIGHLINYLKKSEHMVDVPSSAAEDILG